MYCMTHKKCYEIHAINSVKSILLRPHRCIDAISNSVFLRHKDVYKLRPVYFFWIGNNI